MPNAEKLYELYKFSGAWKFRYDHGTVYSYSTSWDPDHLVVGGETLRYKVVSETKKGDHAPGDEDNRIEMNTIKKNVSGTWSDADTSIGFSDDPMEMDLNASPGEAFRIWDSRCDS